MIVRELYDILNATENNNLNRLGADHKKTSAQNRQKLTTLPLSVLAQPPPHLSLRTHYNLEKSEVICTKNVQTSASEELLVCTGQTPSSPDCGRLIWTVSYLLFINAFSGNLKLHL